MNDTLFLSIPRALHFAYLMQAFAAMPESSLAVVMARFMKEKEVWNPRPAKTVDFRGLSRHEIFAECAGIRAAVVRECPTLERTVVACRYELTDYAQRQGGRVAYFTKARADAFESLAHHARATWMPHVPEDVMTLLVAHAFVSKRETPITLRRLADEYGYSHTHWHRQSNKLAGELAAVEARALDALTPYFTRQCHGVSLA
ncbi:hypothetical protein [Burkholderia sp. LMG 32019]|uniref:hypothetical protein n=1 Tax=Burkholderia sp. LMG 32019 TaxID=3158173 RepID=UPI003C2B8381